VQAPTFRVSSPAGDRSAEMARWLRAVWVALGVIGLLARLAAIADPRERLFWQFPTEDGYLTLTIARNLGMGNGMSVAEGTIPTNGTQPLVALLWSTIFALVGGDRMLGVGGVLCCEIALSVVAAVLLAKLGSKLCGESALEHALVRVLAAAWFASPVVIPHTMNCLETTLNAVLVLTVALAFLKLGAVGRALPLPSIAKFGALLGAAFWARNDAVYLGAGVGLAHVLMPNGASRLRRTLEVAGFAVVAIVVGSPWLVYNQLSFGHIVPISGRSESLMPRTVENFQELAVSLAEYVGVVLPVPDALSRKSVAVLPSAGLALAAAYVLVRIHRRAGAALRSLIVALALYAVCLAAQYAIAFEAPYFMARYMFPISPFLALLWLAPLGSWLSKFGEPRVFRVARLASVLVCFVTIALAIRVYARGPGHEHRQVVEWVERNVPRTSWVGAAQSGTLGFFHDRTVNLDGKVNPEALEARRAHRIPEYAVAKGLEFIADWHGFASWIELPPFARHFELLVDDEEQNLAVLRRRGKKSLPELAREPGP
jgi:hypothetical protein